ncbi:hypothetical protein BYT27DRAFT_7234587 [Phlegmacium glaucopus]|nr:hypothetical protein BYT27DRAFT_7234587 [Phlegmacium glaucopus]
MTAHQKVLKEKSVHGLMNKGVFTDETRNVVRLLVKAGCSQNYINRVLHGVLSAAGIKTIGTISRPTITRIMREGYYAAQIQLGYELKNAASMIFSADGTSHCSINYNSRHVNLKAEVYGADVPEKERVTRFFGIKSSCDGSNHRAKEKKDARLMELLKSDAIDHALGEEAILEKTVAELDILFEDATKKMTKAAGGKTKWDALSNDSQAEKRATMMELLVAELGKEAFEMLSADEKRTLKLFIWAGCGCHKDLNTVRGGYVEMAQWWHVNNVDGPILLANRDNALVLGEREAQIAQDDTTTPAQDRAFDSTSHGAIKATQLAGAILNHKDDKKGHHDTFRWWWFENVGTQFTFPDTSNTCFQSYCDGAAMLLLHLPHFISFLESLCDNKQSSQFNHMETIATKTEFAVLAIYAQAVSHPYMKAVCASGEKQQNMLDLGDLHQKVYDHMQQLIENPDLLVGVGTFDGTPWHSQEVIDKINKLAPDFPHLKPALVAFCTGALVTWKRFTSEFAPGGLIDEATQEERDLAWMPSTDDINEGALGSFRVLMRRQPQLTLLQYNAQTMFFQNNTRAFMNEMFSDTTHQYIRAVSRERDASEKEHLEGIVQHTEEKIAKKVAAKTKHTEFALIFKEDEIDKLKGEKLKDHFQAFKKADAPNLGTINSKSKVAEKREAIKAAIRSYNKGEYEGDVFDGYNDFHSSDENSGWEDDE